MQRRRFALLAALVAIAASGCGTARVNQFRQFSVAGVAYAEAIGPLTEIAGVAAADVDSEVLIRAHRDLPLEDRRAAVLRQNAEARRRLAVLADIARQARLLRSYFIALGALAESDAPSQIGPAAQSIFESLGEVSDRVRAATVGDRPVDEFVGQVVPIAVAAFRSGALERELQARAETLWMYLEIQEAAIRAVAEMLRDDLQGALHARENREVVQPFMGDKLPKTWKKTRREVLTSQVEATSAEAATRAAGQLKLAFVALVEGRFQTSDLQALLDDIGRILTVVEGVEGMAS
jgi:hypothetical protein